MPPKKAPTNAPSKKTEQKKKEKIIEDKTFGLKNKKGAKQQKFVQQVAKQVKDGGNKSWKDQEKEREAQKKLKEDKKKALAEINSLIKPVQQMVAKGVDPKSVLCAYFKEGTCAKGAKCKFSHDLNIQRKSEKRNIYEDEDAEPVPDGQTRIICKHFLEAVESGKFGWFWDCPDGEKCVYRHLLPQGYVLKKDMKKQEKEKETISIEDLVERERAALGVNTTKVTLETFLAWKKKKLKEKAQQNKKEMAKKKSDYKSGKVISGKDLFTFNPDANAGSDGLMEEDDAEFDLKNIPTDPSEEDEENEETRFEYKEINMAEIIKEYKDAGIAGDASRLAGGAEKGAGAEGSEVNGLPEDGAIAIDETLFDDDDDLDDLEDELDELSLS